MTPEGKVVALIKKRVKEAGGEVRKCAWENCRGAPDLLVMLPGIHAWIEAKQKPASSALTRLASTFGCVAPAARCTWFLARIRRRPW